ncbi:hypothetical protein CG719_23155 [Streptomyces sp. CB01373]|nr:hypothetical protein CG719_23155 [Streptomyces sp. CB01373]
MRPAHERTRTSTALHGATLEVRRDHHDRDEFSGGGAAGPYRPSPFAFVWNDTRLLPVASATARMWPSLMDSHAPSFCSYLPPYAPQLNPVEGIWSLLRRRCQANTAFTDPTHLMRALRQGLRQVQYQPDLIDGCLAGTGLTLTRPRLQ